MSAFEDSLPRKPRTRSKADLPKAPVKKRDPMKSVTKTGARMPWFCEEDDNSAAKLMCERVDHLVRVELAPWRKRALECMQIYAGSSRVNGEDSKKTGQIRFNLTRSITDTGAAVLGAARTLPFCQTRGGNWSDRRKALRRNQTLQTQFQDIGVFPQAQRVIYDALITGLGALKFFEDPDRDGGTAGCERVLPLSLVWDPTECSTGSPRDFWQRDLMHRDVAVELFAKKDDGTYDEKMVKAIRDAKGPNAYDLEDFQLTRSGSANQLVIYEGFHLPSSADAEDGAHMIAIPGCALHREGWTRTRLPYAFLHGWQPNQLGFSGASMVDLCRPAQKRIEEIDTYVRKCQILGSGPRLLLPKGSTIEPGQLTNKAWEDVFYEGPQAPTAVMWTGTPPDLEQAKARIREETLAMFGLSTQQVQGEKPSGVTSAVGQRAAEDIQSKRHVMNLRFVEQFYLDSSQCLVDVNDAIATERADFCVDTSVRDQWLEQTKWRDLMPKAGSPNPKMAVLPVSALVGSVASQFDTVQEWVGAGWCTQQTAKFLAAVPDTEGQAEEDTEDTIYSNHLVDLVLDEKIVTSLDPLLSPEVFVSVARPAYLRAKREKAPELVLTRLRNLLGTAKDSILKAQAAANQNAAPPPGAGAPPTGPGGIMADAAQIQPGMVA